MQPQCDAFSQQWHEGLYLKDRLACITGETFDAHRLWDLCGGAALRIHYLEL